MTENLPTRTLGAEIEKTVSDVQTGKSHHISQNFFKSVGGKPKFSDVAPETMIGSHRDDIGDVALDNAFNLQETSSRVTNSLPELAETLNLDLQLVQGALAKEGASIINLAIHPLASTSKEFYQAMVAPKGIYPYILDRGWDHAAGIDGKSQNSPSTGVNAHEAAKAVTTMIGIGAATVGIFANSPFREGKLSDYQETRLTMWQRMMGSSRFPGDLKTAQFPEKPFNTIADYMHWMFGQDTTHHFVIHMANDRDYKSLGDAIVLIEGDPSTIDYLRQDQASGKFFANNKQPITLTPSLSHLEAMQFAQFAGARIRWGFDHSQIDKDQFLEALDGNKLEELFSRGTNFIYIEGRDAGANFADRQILDQNPDLKNSVHLSPSALQLGIINNLSKAHQVLIEPYSWDQLKILREQAIKKGLNGSAGNLTVFDFAKKALEVAMEGLNPEEQRYLQYAVYVLEQKTNGADRAIADFHNGVSIKDIVRSRHVLV